MHTPKRTVVDVLHGVEIRDDYRWLEDDTPEVAAWTDAQNARTRAVLDHAPSRPSVEARLRPLMEIGVVTAPMMRGDRYFFTRREGTEDQARVFWRRGHAGSDHLLIDPVAIDSSGLTTVEWISPSHDGRLLAFGTYRSGDENTTLRLMDVDAGRVLPLEIPNKTQTAQWLPDGSGFVYQNLDDPRDPYSGRVRFHRLGTNPESDALLFRQLTTDEDAALATTWGPFAKLSTDGRWLLLGYWTDTRSNDLWIADFRRFLVTGRLDRVPVSVGESGVATGTVIADVLYLQTTQRAPNGRIVSVHAATPSLRNWRDIVPERRDGVIESSTFGRGLIAVTYLRSASNVTEVFDVTGLTRGRLRQPGIGASAVSAEEDRTEAFLTFTSFNCPTTVLRVDLAQPGAAPAVWAKPMTPLDPSTIAVAQVWYPSKDGTKISMFLVHATPGLKPRPTYEGPRPTLLSGYGGFNISETPVFSPAVLAWVQDGGVYAVPNLRGGGEYGDAWHEAGMLGKKQNVFDDFIAAAEWLIDERWTTPEQLAIAGGSNGGLLVGAALTQRPELFAAAICAVPLLDMLRYQHFLMARYWVPEYGSAENPDQFRYLAAYSPYHRVRDDVRYPAVFLTAGEYDTRVHAMHARKMAARLQAATVDAVTCPVLLWVDRDAGHGQGKPLALRLRDAVDQQTFLAEMIGSAKKAAQSS